MRLETVQDEIRNARNECYKKQKEDKKPSSVEVKINNDISFIAVESGTSVVVCHSRKKRNYKLSYDHWINWFKNNHKVTGETSFTNPKEFGFNKDTTKNDMKMFMLER